MTARRRSTFRRSRPDRRYHDRRDPDERRQLPADDDKPIRKVLVTGSRDWRDAETIIEELRKLAPGTVVVHGGCRGADCMAAGAAAAMGLAAREYAAEWERLGPMAGPARNQRMIDEEHREDEPIDLCLAFADDMAGSRGTKDCSTRAAAAGIEVRVVRSRRAIALDALAEAKARDGSV